MPLRYRVFLGAAVGMALALPARADLVITEIHYAPVDAGGQPQADLEFVEVFNDGSEPYDLAGYQFTQGISFVFTSGTFLDAESYIVVCRNAVALRTAYGITNAVGDFDGILDNAGETVTLANPQGREVSSVSYNDRGRWPSGAKGTGHSLSIFDPFRDASDADNWALSVQMGGTPGGANFGSQATFQDTIIVNTGETWKYFKGTQAPSSPVTAWRQVGFAAGSWLDGATGIGYGDGDDATNLTDMEDGYLTIFCRKVFTAANVSQIENLVLSITYDDGFYAYLNGTEVASRNVNGTAFDNVAGPAIEPTQEDIDITGFKNLLVDGSNVLAVQVHNSDSSSSDLSFIPRLVSRRVIPPTQTSSVPVVINEGYCRLGPGQRFVELYNTSASPVDLSGYWLSDDFASLEKYVIPNGTSIAARGLLAFTEAQTGLDFSVSPGVKDTAGAALTNPAGTRVVDARVFRQLIDGRSEARMPDGDRDFQPATTPTPGAPNVAPANDTVIFNEIMYHTISGDEREEYIELYNRGASSVDISDWRVEGVDLTLPPGTAIGPGAYLVIAKDPSLIRNRHGLAPALVVGTPWAGTLQDGGERLKLVDVEGNVVDSVRFQDGGTWTEWADGGGSSLELIAPLSDNDVGSSWDASDDSAKATVQTLSYSGVPFGGGESDFGMMLAETGIMIIDDISLVRTGQGTNLITNGTFDTNTTPWRIEGTHIRSGRTTDASERITGAGSLKLICWNGSGDYKVNRVECDTSQQLGGTYTVSFKARWRVGSNRILTIGDYNVGQPSNPGIAGSSRHVLPQNLGTPGAQNSVTARQISTTGSDNIGPAIDRVSHAPGVPEANQQVTISARVRDPDGVASVRVLHRTDTPVGSFTQVNMTDGDGDGIYTAMIPGQALNTRVLFYVEAIDGPGALTRFPTDVFKRSHPPVLNPSSPAVNDHLYCMYRHDTRNVSTPHHSYRFILNQPNQDYLQTRKVHSNEVVDGTFVFGSGTVYYNSQIRFAGSPWLRQSNSFDNSYALKMPKDAPLHERKKAFNLDEHGNDGRERISHYLFRQNACSTTLPYWDFHTLVRFQLNSVKTATFEALDKPNSQYISFWFPDADKGAFFEMDDRFGFNDNGDRTGNADGYLQYPPYGTSGGSNPENYRWFFSPRSKENADDFGPLTQLGFIMDPDATSDSNFDQVVFGYVDVEELLRVWSIELNIDDWDTWGGRRGKNAYLYLSPADNLWRKVPWDLELTYGDGNAFAMPASPAATYGNFFPEIQRLINRPRIKRMYYGILAEQVDTATGFFHSAFLTPYMQRLAGAGVGSTNIGTSGGFIDARAGRIRTWIQSSIYPQVRLTITTNGGNPLSTPGLTADLGGTAPADIFYLIVSRNGVLLDPSPEVTFATSNMNGWTIAAIPLVPGLNTIEVIGTSSQGDLVDADSIQVTSTSNWNSPVLTQVNPATGAEEDLITLAGTDFHTGVRVFFGAVEAASVAFNEVADPTHITAGVPGGLALGSTTVKVRNADGKESNTLPFTVTAPAPRFIRGDGNLDGLVDVSDALKVVLHLFAGVSAACLDALDADDSGGMNVTDAIRILDYLFKAGIAPAAPFPGMGRDATTGDSLDCQQGLP